MHKLFSTIGQIKINDQDLLLFITSRFNYSICICMIVCVVDVDIQGLPT